ncbi:MAG TPA: hypothetical protein PKZ40_03745 [Anaerolineaceae bacterium]|nr:hypothetical protein [Clostridia bacterium]HPK26836.1 hypothetical protein [Anaerolineaceae bacterium]
MTRKKKAPHGSGKPTQRRDINQYQYTRTVKILQAWGYENISWWDVENILAAARYAKEAANV